MTFSVINPEVAYRKVEERTNRAIDDFCKIWLQVDSLIIKVPCLNVLFDWKKTHPVCSFLFYPDMFEDHMI